MTSQRSSKGRQPMTPEAKTERVMAVHYLLRLGDEQRATAEQAIRSMPSLTEAGRVRIRDYYDARMQGIHEACEALRKGKHRRTK